MTREEVIAALADVLSPHLWFDESSQGVARKVLDWVDSIGYTAQFLDEDNGNGILAELGSGETR